jgi:hypothetical protein
VFVALAVGYAVGLVQSPGDSQESFESTTNDPAGPDGMASQTDDPDGPPLRLVGSVQFDGDDSELPVVSGPGLDEEWLRNQPPLLSEYERSVLQQRGWQVLEERQVITVKLDDGRRLAIPLDSLSYRYVGGRVH